MNRHIFTILAILLGLLPLAATADEVVQGTVTLNGETIAAEYSISGTTARLGSGLNACISQYSVGKVVVPASITVNEVSYPVTEVSAFAFRMCNRVTEVVLPEGITRIGDFAFVSCRSLAKATLPSTLTSIGTGAFIDLPALTQLDIYAIIPPTWEYNDVFCYHEGGISDTMAYYTGQVALNVPAIAYRRYDTTNYTIPELGWTTPDGWGYFTNLGITDDTINYDVIFIHDGGWDEPDNWNIGEVPQWPDNNVLIVADAIIPDGYVAEANEITIGSGSITIKDGGQLVHSNTGVVATVEKDITGFGQDDGGLYLLANPVIDEQDPVALGMADGEYDLYRFDQSGNPEWIDFEQDTFGLMNRKGYLYGKENNANIAFHGELNPATVDVSVDLAYDTQANLAGFNLVGNPYCCNAYLADSRDFFALNADRKEIIVATDNVIVPMQGIFVQAAEEETLTFTTTATDRIDAFTISLSDNGGATHDIARFRMGEGHGLQKLQIDTAHSRLYITLEDKNYAVAYIGEPDEIPVNIMVEANGTYTLNFDNEGITFNYLHLIDNLTGNDVDLLASQSNQPEQGLESYTFDAQTTDNEDRFTLRFVEPDGIATLSTENTETFAFLHNSEIHITDTSHGATLQVIDMTGRIIVCKEATSPVSTSGMPAGTYLIRLISGNNARTQKLTIN